MRPAIRNETKVHLDIANAYVLVDSSGTKSVSDFYNAEQIHKPTNVVGMDI